MQNRDLTKYWTSIWVISGIVAGIAFLVVYNCYERLHVGSALIWAFAYFVMGGLAGFIFGVPKIITNNSSPDAAALKTGAPNTNRKVIQENTNLTQVSDWLTKVIIGAGLVQLKEIPAFILKIARRMSEGIAAVQQNIPSVTILSAGIILYFATWGFVCGYLIMRLVITDLLASDSLEGESR